MTTLIDHIGQLVVVPPGPVAGPGMARIPRIQNAALLIEDGRIAWFGPRDQLPSGCPPPQCGVDPAARPGRSDTTPRTLDAGGGCVIPGLIDCHTHALFVGSREHEFVQKIQGRSYLDILQSGGGILSTVAAVRAASEDDLVAAARPRLLRMLACGVTTVEIKSGYGLSIDDELRMLRAARRLAAELPLEIVSTYLAAHALPAEFAGRADEYIDTIAADAVFETIRRENLAEFADVFCERGAFTVEQSERFLLAAVRHGLRPKVHADQLSQMGASALAARLRAVSADHLEHADDEAIAALRDAGTIPVLLPGCSLFLNSPPADARRLIAAGLPVAVATDFNPGSCMIDSLPLVLSLACTLLRMTPIEALVAATANAAAALARADRLGAIAVGHQADLVILDVPNVERLCYEIGRNAVRRVLVRGCVVHPQG